MSYPTLAMTVGGVSFVRADILEKGG